VILPGTYKKPIFGELLTGAVIGTGGWGEQGSETGNYQSSEPAQKHADSQRPVHPRNIAGRSFFPKGHGHVLRTLC
jgi:hypothetical protein